MKLKFLIFKKIILNYLRNFVTCHYFQCVYIFQHVEDLVKEKLAIVKMFKDEGKLLLRS